MVIAVGVAALPTPEASRDARGDLPAVKRRS